MPLTCNVKPYCMNVWVESPNTFHHNYITQSIVLDMYHYHCNNGKIIYYCCKVNNLQYAVYSNIIQLLHIQYQDMQ